jgi:TonB-linked SusC/RagA family outer membrane protein
MYLNFKAFNLKNTHMRRILILMLGVFVLCTELLAQTRTVTGRVVDNQGNPIPGASVTIRGTNSGTVTREDGSYSLTVPATARVIVISAVGQATQEITLGTQTTINVTLQQGAQANLQEVVVTTGYTRERRSQFAGAATVLSGRVVETTPVGAFDQALQGRAPGMLVNSGSGQPGSSASIQIRGPQSITAASAQPLFVIDGVPMPAFDMQTINPNDFESITILKDASASALYGARGGTGVIVITTKRGRSGTNFTFRTQAGFTQRPSFDRLNLMNTAEILEYEERLGVAGATTNTPGWVYSPKNPTYATLPATSPATNPFAASKARYNSILDSIRQIDINYADEFYRQGFSQTHELNMSAGTDKTRIFLSGQFFDQEGIDLGSSLRRYTTRFNIDHTANKLSITWNTMAGYSNSKLSEGEWLGNSARSPFQMTYRAKPYENPYNADGSLRFGSSTTLNLRQIANLLEGIENSQWTQNQLKVNSGLTLAYRVLPFLTLRNTTGIDFSGDNFTRFVNANSYIGSLQTYQSGTYIDAFRATNQLTNTTGALFNTSFNEIHNLEAGAYFEVVRGRQRALGFQLFNLDPRLTQTGQGAGQLPTNNAATMPQNATAAKTGFGIRSIFGTARYTYNNKYTLTGNIRRDGTSRIVNPENREITTWSAGVIWNAIKESFLANQNLLTDLRVRASYGVVPNIGSIPTSSYGMYGISPSVTSGVTNYQGPQETNFVTTTYAGSTTAGIRPSAPGNPDLRIEKIQKANLGIDFAFWQNRARFIVEAYQNRTIDLFVRNPLSTLTGFANIDVNAGIMTNKGFEFQTAIDIVRSRNLNFNIGWNHAINKNKIEDLGAVDEYFLGTFLIKEGLPYGSHYTYNYLGADPATGQPMYEAEDGTVTMDPAKAGQFAKFGTFLPKHVGGFTGDVSFKGFSVSTLFSYQFDVVRSNNTRNWITRGTAGYHASVNASREMLTNQWQKPGDQVLFQAPIYDRGFTSSDLEDARFLRFRSLTVAYQIPQIRAGGNQLLKGARFYIQGQNIAVWSPWTGLDPEDNNNISLNEYPNPKMIVAGLDINF